MLTRINVDQLTSSRESLVEAAFADLGGKTQKTNLELELALSLAHLAAVLKLASKPHERGGPLPNRLSSSLKSKGVEQTTAAHGAVLLVQDNTREFHSILCLEDRGP